MKDENFMTAEDVAKELGISRAYAYKIIRKFNAELDAKGYFTLAGRVNKQYFMKRTCYGGGERKDDA